MIWEVGIPLESKLDNENANIKITSTYFSWETQNNFYPDFLDVSFDKQANTLRINYQMSYLEACTSPIEFNLTISEGLKDVFAVQLQINEFTGK